MTYIDTRPTTVVHNSGWARRSTHRPCSRRTSRISSGSSSARLTSTQRRMRSQKARRSSCLRRIPHRVVDSPVSVTRSARHSGGSTIRFRWRTRISLGRCSTLVDRTCIIMYVCHAFLFDAVLTFLCSYQPFTRKQYYYLPIPFYLLTITSSTPNQPIYIP